MLTKEQLLKSSPSDYMSGEQLSFFKNILIEQRNTINRDINECREILNDNELEADPLDSACSEEIKQITLLRVQRNTFSLHEIEESLNRITTKEYGYCQETGDPIGLARLLANPTATLCIDSLENEERRQKIEGNIVEDHEDENNEAAA
ncbi:MAG: TraR/DksA C4-type zinc finger protein [Pseudomonadota bacterium]|nr:TraR/DksA C4-type zinc finger protein [Pseudomonadota bacterium]